ncbi:MAG: diacylglycerol kinase [Desulfuromonas sp.]|nr:diacylglycerol kinase [Desulfuromonas sp.]
MAKPGKRGIARIIDAFGYSRQGLKATWQHEAAFRQETYAVCALTPAACWLGSTLSQIALLLASLYGVIIAELINSAIESVVDRIGDEHHELAGRAKDQGSALVLVAIAITTLVWLLVSIERFTA